jgi:hypothetical protein
MSSIFTISADHAVDRDRQRHPDHRQGGGLDGQGLVGDVGQGDGHDLARQDQVGADRAAHLLGLQLGAAQGQVLDLLAGHLVVREGLDDLLGGLEGQIGPAAHQDRRHRPGREGAEDQRAGQQEQQLVAERADRDLPDDRQLAIGREPHGVAGGDGGVVDHHPHGLGARLAGGGAHVVQRGGRQLGDAGDVVEKGGEAGGHGGFSAAWIRLRE